MIPDAPELIHTFLENESDHTCKRNAFAALSAMSHEKALAYLSGVFDGIQNADELLQLVELEFIRKDAVQNSQNKVPFLASYLCVTLYPNLSPGPLPEVDLRSFGGWSNNGCI